MRRSNNYSYSDLFPCNLDICGPYAASSTVIDEPSSTSLLFFFFGMNVKVRQTNMLRTNIFLLWTEIQIDNAQGEAAGGATIEQLDTGEIKVMGISYSI